MHITKYIKLHVHLHLRNTARTWQKTCNSPTFLFFKDHCIIHGRRLNTSAYDDFLDRPSVNPAQISQSVLSS